MKRTAPAIGAIALLLLSGACASSSLLPDSERASIEREVQGKVFYLRAPLNVFPFFSDTSKLLASPYPSDSIDLLETPEGQPILPGSIERKLELGAHVRIERVEQPTSLVVSRRPLYSPRTLPWVYFSLVGETYTRPYVAVLKAAPRTADDFLRAFDTLFTRDDPTPALNAYPVEIRQAIREKRLVPGMDTAAVELAWGQPEKIRVVQDSGTPTATWSWPLGVRTAQFRDNRLVSSNPAY